MNLQELIAFIQTYVGVPGTGDTAANKGQCVGLIELWIDRFKLPHVWGNAAQLLTEADPKHYTVVANGPANFPSPGDVLVWGTSWGGGFGHTGIVVAATSMHVVVFEQNDPEGSPPLVATHTYDGVTGWLKLKVA